MTKFKVAFFADTLKEDLDGAVRTMYQIINRIPRNEFEFLFIVGEKPLDTKGHKFFKTPSVKLPFNDDYRMSLSIIKNNQIKETLDNFKADVIHIATPSLLGNHAMKYARKNHIPVISIYHTNFLSYVQYYFKDLGFLKNGTEKFLQSFFQKFYNSCDRLLVPTDTMISELKNIGILESLMVKWPRGLNHKIFRPDDKQEVIYGTDKFKILFASRLVWEKNLETLLNIYNTAVELNLPYEFIIAGDGVAREKLQSEMPEALFLGNISQNYLADLYRDADLFLFPSISETYGNVVVEAMACGLPCVLANGGGSRDLVIDGENGFLCEAYDIMSYIDRIEELRSSIDLRNTISRNAVSSTQDLQWDLLIDKYFEVLRELSGRSRTKAA